MAWERRKGGLFYYRSLRINGRVKKQYVGKGPMAELAARMDAANRAYREGKVAARRQVQETYKAVLALLVDLDEHVKAFMFVELDAAGFYNHRGEWRRRRDE
jgi:hypothetical protein